ncbi:MAG: hypothetical protein PHE93_00790 [Clostridia bacterium]|nr:hypothetical protein [Clostridia bacterium]
MSFWDEFKKLFQTNQQREEEKANKINDAIKNESSLTSKLQELEKQYQSSLPKSSEVDLESLFPSSLGLSKIDYDAKSDEELKQQAEAELMSSLENQKSAIQKEISTQKDNVSASKDTLTQDAENSLAELDELYSSLKDKAEKNALKRGLGRSSVITSQIGEYDEKQTSSATVVHSELLDQIADVNQKLIDLEAEKDSALNELDLTHASEVATKIAKLQKERDATALQYQKYNDDISKQETAYSSERAKSIKEYLAELETEKSEQNKAQREAEETYGYTGDKQKNYAERYTLALDFYNSLSPDISADALAASPNMKFYLGNYYDKLMSVLKAKSSSTNRYY